MRLTSTLLSLAISATLSTAQDAPGIEWQRCLGGPQGDEGRAITVDEDGNYYLAGANENGPNGGWDFVVTKLDNEGTTVWQRSYGGSGFDKPDAIARTTTGDLFVFGNSNSTDGDVTGNHGDYDALLLKLDPDGELIWGKCFGGPGGESGRHLTLNNNGELLLACFTDEEGGDVGSHIGGVDYWIVKCDLDGTVIWERTYGGTGDDFASNVLGTNDGGYILGGGTRSIDGDVSQPAVEDDIWIVKLANDGTLEWETSLGGSGSEGGRVIQRSDGGYVVFGNTNSTDGDVSTALGGVDIWIAHLSSTGDLQSERSSGGTGSDSPRDLFEMEDGGYFISANTSSPNGDVVGYHGGFFDLWAVRLDPEGNVIWQKPLGGSADDRCSAGTPTPNGGYALFGFSNSTNGDVTSAFPGYDAWIVKLEADNVSVGEGPDPIMVSLFPNPATDEVRVLMLDQRSTYTNFELVDVMGRIWDLKPTTGATLNELRFDVSELASGLYILRAFDRGRVYSLPLVKR